MSGYTPELLDAIRRVEKTRSERLERARRGEHAKPLTMEEREERLRRYHPDFKTEGKRALRVGPSKGDVVPEELADLLESKSRLNPDRIDLSRPDLSTDVLIIGGGGAGTAAALIAQEKGARVLIATKLRHGDSNTVMAEGGVQAADQEGDSPYFHYIDVMGGGHFTNDPELVSAMAHDAPLAIRWLEELGMLFDKHPDGRMKVRHGGGTSRKRLHSAGDMTGTEIMRVLRDEARSRPDIRVIEFGPAVELLLDVQGRCAGAILQNLETREHSIVRAKAVILATGGFGRLHIQGFPCTNHYGATADGLVMAYRAGVGTSLLDSTQYHPTGAIFPEQNVGLLITEKVRGLGAYLVNAEGEEFCFALEPRDVASSCIIRECGERGKGITTPTGRRGIWLDSPMIDHLHGPGTVERELPAKFIQFRRYGIDIGRLPMLVYPTLHYQNGGIRINARAETTVPGLFAAGEVTGGVHGKNRLMGNSLLDILVFGRRAGENAAGHIQGINGAGRLTLDHVLAFERELRSAGVDHPVVGPMLLPDYLPDEIRNKQWVAPGGA